MQSRTQFLNPVRTRFLSLSLSPSVGVCTTSESILEMATSSREARRRRIVDRGSDRLALITGRIQTLPSSSSSSTELSHQPIVLHDDEDKSPSSLLPQHESAVESGEINANDGGSRDQPVLRQSETNTEDLRAASWEIESKSQSSKVSSAVQDSLSCPSDTQFQHEPQVHRGRFFTPNQISSAVTATERTRIYCSLAVAILVVMSCIGFPILGTRIIKSVIFFRPFYLVLLTNVTIVIARLLLNKQRGVGRTEHITDNVSSVGGYGLAEQVGKALESGLVLQNIMGAVFMDFSAYALTVICCLSVAQKLGW